MLCFGVVCGVCYEYSMAINLDATPSAERGSPSTAANLEDFGSRRENRQALAYHRHKLDNLTSCQSQAIEPTQGLSNKDSYKNKLEAQFTQVVQTQTTYHTDIQGEDVTVDTRTHAATPRKN